MSELSDAEQFALDCFEFDWDWQKLAYLIGERDRLISAEKDADLATAQQQIADLLAHVESQAYELFTVMADNGRLQGTVSDQASVLEDQNKIIAQKDYEIASLSYDGTHINWYQRCITAEKTLRLAQNDLATAQQQVRDLRAALKRLMKYYPGTESTVSASPWAHARAALAATAEPEAER